MKRSLLIIIALVTVGLGLCAYHAYRGAARRIALQQRMRDVEALTRLYMTNPTLVLTTRDLTACAEMAGIHLNSPIPKDPSLPSYRVARHGSNDNTLQIIIEETDNVADPYLVVRSVSDGHVEAARKNKD